MEIHTTIKLKPILRFWLLKYFVIAIFMLLIPLSALYIEDKYILISLLGLYIVVLLVLYYTYLDMLFATKWIVTENEILSHRGLLSRKVDHLELYRITDYSEKQSFLQLIFKCKTVKLTSSDPSHPVLYLYGISKEIALIEELRKRVESQKNKRGVYEVTNR